MKSVALSLLTAAGLATVAFAQTQSGSANVVDPYAPASAPNATPSKPVIQPGTDTPVNAPVSVNPDAQVSANKFARMDKDQDGRVSLSEFTSLYTENKAGGTNQSGMQSGTDDAVVIFKRIDTDGDSFLSAMELSKSDEELLKK